MKLFAALREQAGARERALDLADGASVADVWPALGLGRRADRPRLRGQPRLRRARHAPRRRRRGGADPSRLRRCLPALGGAALARARPSARSPRTTPARSPRSSGTTRARSRGREVDPPRVRGVRGDGRGRDGAHRRGAARAARRDRRRDPPSGRRRSRSARRASSSQSRRAPRRRAFDACREAIDTLKETVPLWKKEIYVGGEEWIGQGS